ncbi:hypothetical protein M408DRAFT_65909 [Serendipita vermifera MAFF 305830]|uniref:P-loop containing nucleoside triphosphate hydrolase protein n=1 Tax=Serendipita vermifera MAFF 305830 TaxID=933852 RepID=A0A0C3BHF4_SERVB|nr:hypothetical protein M408DRAFT_65909 [Serendipita vermifera MAFF 305830]
MKLINLRFRAYRILSLRTASTCIRHIHSSGVKNSQGEWQLRAYQDECISACLTAIDKGINRIGVSLPTGSGKTTTFVALLHQLPVNEMRPEATKSIIIVNSVHLANQTVQQVKKLYPNTTVEVERGEHVATGKADITVSTFQTLRRRLHKYPPERVKAVIVDEAHHAAAPTYISILSHFDPRISPTGLEITTHSPPIIGFSATFTRHDDRPLGKVFQAIVYHRDFLDMIKAEWLCDVRFTTVMAQIDLSSIETSDTGDFKSAELGRVMNTNKMNAAIAQSWLEKAANRKSTIIFCADLAHVHGVTNEFRKKGVDAHSVDGKTPEKAREQLLRDFRAGNFPVIVNCGVLLEGADFPNIDCVMVARPTCSRNLFAQMIGRGMRLSPETGKQNCHIIDFVDSRRDMEDVFSTSSLFQLHPHDGIEGFVQEFRRRDID